MGGSKNNEAKEYLQQVKLCDVHINNRLEELAKLKILATKITSTLSCEPGVGYGNQDKLGDAVSKIVDMERDIDEAVDSFVDKKNEVRKLLEKVKNPDQLDVLCKVYFQYKTLEQAACEMGYSYRNVCYIHGKALQEVERLLKK